jgi:hypothetical protein
MGENRENTASPARNFTITLEDHVRAAAGPPAWVTRKRSIEDIEAGFVRDLVDMILEGKSEEDVRAHAETIDLRPLRKLVDAHNRYYPIEANLPIHRTGVPMERAGVLWKPFVMVTAADLCARARVMLERE